MKKSIFLIVLLLALLSSCANQAEYIFTHVRWLTSPDVEHLIADAELIYIATVTGVSFVVIDRETGLPATAETHESHFELFTLWEMDILEVLMGEPINSHIATHGGVQHNYTRAQLRTLEPHGIETINIFSPSVDIEIGLTYLFSLVQCSEDYLGTAIMNPLQSVLRLDDPFMEHHGGITVESIITTAAGINAWEDFYSQWQRGEFR